MTPYLKKRDMLVRSIHKSKQFPHVNPEKVKAAALMAVQRFSPSHIFNSCNVSMKLADELVKLAVRQMRSEKKRFDRYPIDASMPWLGEFVELKV